MRMTYSAEADALAIDLADGAADRTVRVARGIAADLDAEGRLLSVEILNASRHYPREVLEAVGPPLDEITLAEAAKESGLTAATLRRQCGAGRIAGVVKRGRDWLIPRHALYNYLESRAPQGRPAAKKKARRTRKAKASR